jgi:SagB-type dehydrogenase family enzyme
VSDPPRSPTVNVAERVYGSQVDAADPAELLHEASKLRPATIARELQGVWELEQSELLQISSTRSVRRNPALPAIALPRSDLPGASLSAILRERRSTRRFAPTPLPLEQIAALLDATYGVSVEGGPDYPALRVAPSAGALYPLEIFVVARRVDGIREGVYHYDALQHVLRRIGDAPDPAAVSPHADIVESAAVVVIVSAVFWRSRFKYGLRAYRFTLLEAGHAMQNALLAATAFGIGSIVLGGFYDGRIDALLDLDGVNESSLVLACFGAMP